MDGAEAKARISDPNDLDLQRAGFVFDQACHRWTDPSWGALLKAMTAQERLTLFQDIRRRMAAAR